MRQKSGPRRTAEEHVKGIRRVMPRQRGDEEKIRIVPEGFRDDYSIAELRRREGIAQSLY